MAFQLNIAYRNQSVCCDVAAQEESVCLLRLTGTSTDKNGDCIPGKMDIRKKGKIWISDMDTNSELASSLIKEIIQFEPEK